MVKVSIQVRSGAARVKVSVMAESVERALSFVSARFPGGDIRILSPGRPTVPAPEPAAA